ncbi:MAG: hypothetical protein U9P07_05965 [Pseudomonadota bacterium]|nr:hypothetical protein [Pseudomonadota bacterium]
MKTTNTITSVKIFPLLLGFLLAGSLLLGGCQLSMQSFTAPDAADTGTVITLSFDGEAVDIGDGASEHGLVLQLPGNWTVLSAIADVGAPMTISLTENSAYESLYTAEAGCKVWVGTSTNSGEGDRSVTGTVKILVGEFAGSIGDVQSFSLKAMAGALRDGAWMTDDPAGIFDFGVVTEEPYVEGIEVTKVFDDSPPAPITTLTVTDLCDGQALLSWYGYDEAGQGDVVQYNIYQDTVFFTDVVALAPGAVLPPGMFEDVVSLPYDTEYFFAVTAVDELGNEEQEVISQSIILRSPCPGDFDQDQDVDGSDLAVFAADFGRTDCQCTSSMPFSASSAEDPVIQEIQSQQDEILKLRAELAAREKRLEELVNSATR